MWIETLPQGRDANTRLIVVALTQAGNQHRAELF
jgi:hypothetical protein